MRRKWRKPPWGLSGMEINFSLALVRSDVVFTLAQFDDPTRGLPIVQPSRNEIGHCRLRLMIATFFTILVHLVKSSIFTLESWNSIFPDGKWHRHRYSGNSRPQPKLPAQRDFVLIFPLLSPPSKQAEIQFHINFRLLKTRATCRSREFSAPFEYFNISLGPRVSVET